MILSVPVIIGSGLAGLSAALSLAPRPVIVLGRPFAPGLTSSSLAQGGLAAAVGPDDTPELHAQDTMKAGAGLCDALIVELITKAAPSAVEKLAGWGVVFDCDEKGAFKTGLEGAHARHRIVHACGDATGAVIMRALIAKAAVTPSIEIREGFEAISFLSDDHGAMAGVVCRDTRTGALETLATRQVILASGSACALWSHTTVPLGSWGHGLALAARAGAYLRDLEFVQFHPTALNVGIDPMPLVSEAVRGEGAKLVTEAGASFVDELLPRDIVARAIWAEIEKGHRIFLDARAIPVFGERFPTIAGLLAEAKVDPACEPIPIFPVSHYHMGGVATDAWARTNVPGLWACGECAATGLHGANRLASNSLLEATVMGCRAAESVSGMQPVAEAVCSHGPEPLPPETPEEITSLRKSLCTALGIARHAAGLSSFIDQTTPLAARSPRALVALMIAQAALARQESRGAHYRTDFPSTDPAAAHALTVALEGSTIRVGA